MKTTVYNIVVSLCLFISCQGGAGEPKCDAKTDEILHRIADFYHNAASFTVGIQLYRIHLAPAVKNERWVRYDVAVQRPNKVSFILKDGGDITYAWVCDGARVQTYMASLGKYTSRKAPASMDELSKQEEVELIKGTLESNLFLNLLMKDNPYEAMLNEVQSGKYIGSESQGGSKLDRMQFTADKAKWDLCVQDGPQPLVRMFLPAEPTEPEGTSTVVTITFDRWTVNNPVPDERFRFVPPAGAKKVSSFFKKIEPPSPLLRRQAPDTKLKLLDGSVTDLARLRGKNVVVLDFWATWCVPCCKALPTMEELAGVYKNRGVVFYAVNSKEDAETIKSYLDFHNFRLNAVVDKEGTLFSKYGVHNIPQTVIIDKNGIVQAMHGFLADDVKEMLTSELDTVLEGKNVPIPAGDDADGP